MGALAGGKGNWLLASVLFTALSQFTYVALSVVLLMGSMGIPIPEDVPLIFSGYLCHEKASPIANIEIDTDGDGRPDMRIPVSEKVPKIQWMILAGMIGVLLGDSIVFNIGRHGIESDGFVSRHLRKVMHSRRREKVERHFARHGNLTIFVGRFLPGFRSLVFAFAGLSKMSYFRFIIIDGLAAAISVPSFILLGFYFAPHLNIVLSWLERIKHIVIPAAVAVIVIVALIYFLRRRRQAAALENI